MPHSLRPIGTQSSNLVSLKKRQFIKEENTHLEAVDIRLKIDVSQYETIEIQKKKGKVGHKLGSTEVIKSTTKRILAMLDITGLIMITASTLYDLFSVDDYGQSVPQSLVFSGISLQLIGLVILVNYGINYGIKFQEYPNHERFGMFLLSLGPLLKLMGQLNLNTFGEKSFNLFVKGAVAFEVTEFIGMGILDVSMIKLQNQDFTLLVVELVGLVLLAIKSVIEFKYHSVKQNIPIVQPNFECMRVNEAVGYAILVCKAIYQYYEYKVKPKPSRKEESFYLNKF